MSREPVLGNSRSRRSIHLHVSESCCLRALLRTLVGLLLAAPFAYSSAEAQVSLLVSKSGGNVMLSWSNGAGPYDVYRSTTPTFGPEYSALATGTTATGQTDFGAASSPTKLYCYVVSDIPARPAIDITSPCNTPPGGPPCSYSAATASQTISGTTNASVVYVNGVRATLAAGTFSAPIPLFLGDNPITAFATSSAGNQTPDSLVVTRTNGNHAPNISIAISERGGAAIPADGALIHDPTPLITVNYDDASDTPAGVISPADVFVYVNGQNLTAFFQPTSTQATYQVSSGSAWSAGANFIYASVQDGNSSTNPGATASAAAHVTLSNPSISSFSPGSGAARGASIQIFGTGFDPTPANNQVKFAGTPAAVSAATATSLTTQVPSTAQTGEVVVTTEGLSSRGVRYQIYLSANEVGNPSAVAVDPTNSGDFYLTGDNFFKKVQSNGVVTLLSHPDFRLSGLPVDASGYLYFGQQSTYPTSHGFVRQWDPQLDQTAEFVDDTRLPCTPPVFGCYSESNALSTGIAASNDIIYTADSINGTIKQSVPNPDPEPGEYPYTVSAITPPGQSFPATCGMVILSGKLYFTSGSNGDTIKSIPVPGGGTPTVVETLAAPCGGSRGLALSADSRIVIGRSQCVSVFDPANPSAMWDLYSTSPFSTSPPPSVALGVEGGNEFILTAQNSVVFRLPKPTLTITDGTGQPLQSKQVIDFVNPVSVCFETASITLKVQFNPSSLVPTTVPPQNVVWTVEDPDDPSNDSTVDTNGSQGNDNVFGIGLYDQWEENPLYPMTGDSTDNSVETAIVANTSSITFHPSCQPGDNYRFKASVTVPVLGAIETTSNVVTIWRVLHIERDSMGVAIGPFQADDVAIGDIPEPPLAFFAEALRPAYIDVVLPPDTGSDNSDVPFQYNVSGSDVAIRQQAELGRQTTSTESQWIAYIQGAYEGDLSRDNDPDNEPLRAFFGVTETHRNSLSFVETTRDYCAITPFVDCQDLWNQIAIHEIGHQFGLDDETTLTGAGCLMEPPPVINPVFCGFQIKKIREKTIPAAP